MKCDELKNYDVQGARLPAMPGKGEFVKRAEVDAAIAELKAMVTTDNSAVIARLEDDLRKTQRALYKACRNWFRNQACAMRQFNLEARAKKFDKAEERAKEMSENKELKPRHEDKTLQERLNEVCKKYGVSTLQDLDLALCKAYESNTNFCIDAHKLIIRQKRKRCLALAKWCDERIFRVERDYAFWRYGKDYAINFYKKWRDRWLAIADKFKEA